MDRFGNGEEFIMKRTLETEKDGLTFRNFDNTLFTGIDMSTSLSFIRSIAWNPQ
jgi:exonuclease 1